MTGDELDNIFINHDTINFTTIDNVESTKIRYNRRYLAIQGYFKANLLNNNINIPKIIDDDNMNEIFEEPNARHILTRKDSQMFYHRIRSAFDLKDRFIEEVHFVIDRYEERDDSLFGNEFFHIARQVCIENQRYYSM